MKLHLLPSDIQKHIMHYASPSHDPLHSFDSLQWEIGMFMRPRCEHFNYEDSEEFKSSTGFGTTLFQFMKDESYQSYDGHKWTAPIIRYNKNSHELEMTLVKYECP